MKRHRLVAFVLLVAAVLGLATTAHAGITEGLVDIVTGPLELPKQILVGTMSGPPIIGTLAGAIFGAVSAVGTTLRGVGEVAAGAVSLGAAVAPYAPAVLPFVL